MHVDYKQQKELELEELYARRFDLLAVTIPDPKERALRIYRICRDMQEDREGNTWCSIALWQNDVELLTVGIKDLKADFESDPLKQETNIGTLWYMAANKVSWSGSSAMLDLLIREKLPLPKVHSRISLGKIVQKVADIPKKGGYFCKAQRVSICKFLNYIKRNQIRCRQPFDWRGTQADYTAYALKHYFYTKEEIQSCICNAVPKGVSITNKAHKFVLDEITKRWGVKALSFMDFTVSPQATFKWLLKELPIRQWGKDQVLHAWDQFINTYQTDNLCSWISKKPETYKEQLERLIDKLPEGKGIKVFKALITAGYALPANATQGVTITTEAGIKLLLPHVHDKTIEKLTSQLCTYHAPIACFTYLWQTITPTIQTHRVINNKIAVMGNILVEPEELDYCLQLHAELNKFVHKRMPVQTINSLFSNGLRYNTTIPASKYLAQMAENGWPYPTISTLKKLNQTAQIATLIATITQLTKKRRLEAKSIKVEEPASSSIKLC